jgi:hypothetical protein
VFFSKYTLSCQAHSDSEIIFFATKNYKISSPKNLQRLNITLSRGKKSGLSNEEILRKPRLGRRKTHFYPKKTTFTSEKSTSPLGKSYFSL